MTALAAPDVDKAAPTEPPAWTCLHRMDEQMMNKGFQLRIAFDLFFQSGRHRLAVSLFGDWDDLFLGMGVADQIVEGFVLK